MLSTFYIDNHGYKMPSTENVDMTPAQCRAARALVEWTQPRLASEAELGLSTVVDHEKERRVVSQDAVDRMAAALSGAGVEFIAENGGGAGVRLRK